MTKIDPITGPAEDLGVKLNFKTIVSAADADENDGKASCHSSDNNCKLNYSLSDSSSSCDDFPPLRNDDQSYHMPSLCDMLIGFPTQKGYIAYRKPEIGSWYMNAIVQVFSKHAKDTDLCAMLNMVNALISNEVTNTGKKQMSEFTSKFTKPCFYFYPGLASETVTFGSKAHSRYQLEQQEQQQQHSQKSVFGYRDQNSGCCIGSDDQSDSSATATQQKLSDVVLKPEHLDLICDASGCQLEADGESARLGGASYT